MEFARISNPLDDVEGVDSDEWVCCFIRLLTSFKFYFLGRLKNTSLFINLVLYLFTKIEIKTLKVSIPTFAP